ncbi:MAG: hypothetical protein ACHBMF_10100 [Chromatiales bacterium]
MPEPLRLVAYLTELPRDLSGIELASAHDPLKVGTLAAILGDLAAHLKVDREELLHRLFG